MTRNGMRLGLPQLLLPGHGVTGHGHGLALGAALGHGRSEEMSRHARVIRGACAVWGRVGSGVHRLPGTRQSQCTTARPGRDTDVTRRWAWQDHEHEVRRGLSMPPAPRPARGEARGATEGRSSPSTWTTTIDVRASSPASRASCHVEHDVWTDGSRDFHTRSHYH